MYVFQGGSYTPDQIQDLFRGLGSDTAILLDGGGSSAIVLRRDAGGMRARAAQLARVHLAPQGGVARGGTHPSRYRFLAGGIGSTRPVRLRPSCPSRHRQSSSSGLASCGEEAFAPSRTTLSFGPFFGGRLRRHRPGVGGRLRPVIWLRMLSGGVSSSVFGSPVVVPSASSL